MIDERFKEWATETQIRAIDAVNTYGSERKAAVALGVTKTAINKSITQARKKAQFHGYAPEAHFTHPAPDMHVVKGVSTYYNKEGQPAGQWVKTRLDQEAAQIAMKAAIEAFAEDAPRVAPSEIPDHCVESLLNLYTITDAHVGMYAWSKEAGEDWDLKIAEKTIVSAISHLIRNSPKAETALINQLGDYLHIDSLSAVTPTSGHLLDADGRYGLLVKVAVRILRTVVDLALAKHARVIVLIAEGNHDMASSVWLRHLFSLVYENEPRVIVHESEMAYYCHMHGKTMLTFHHGHLRKPAEINSVIPAQFPKEWGAAAHRYCHMGHMHHLMVKENAGITVMQHPTIAARDAYSARNGWIADRRMIGITYHREFGETSQTIVNPDMFAE